MKRKMTDIDDEESQLSHLLFNKSKNFVEKLQSYKTNELHDDLKPAWTDQDDVDIRANIIPGTISKVSYSEKLKQKYEVLMGTPNWAKLNKIGNKSEGDEDEIVRPVHDDDILRTVGHLQKRKSAHLPKDFLEVKRFPKINSETENEGPIITCVEFHPKISVSMVAGQSGVVSLFSIGGDVNNKLHSFRLKRYKIFSAHFTPDGSEAFLASKNEHNYCIYNLVKAEPTLVQLPRIVSRPTIFKMSNNGKFLATSIGYDEIYIISTDSRELLRRLKHNDTVESVSFSHDDQQLYSFGVQGNVTIWDLAIFRVVKKFYDNGCVTASQIALSPCGRLLATGSGEGIVNVYETDKISTTDPVPHKTISNLRTKVTSLKFNATSEILSMSSSLYPNAVKLIHIPSYHVFANFPKQSSNIHQVESVNFSPNSGYMALSNNKGCAYLYRLKYYKNY